PGRDQIVSSSSDGTLIRWEMARGQAVQSYGAIIHEDTAADVNQIDLKTLDQHITWVRDLAISKSGERIFSAGNEGVVFIWDLESAKVVDRLLGNSGVIMCMALSPDGMRLL